MAHFSLPEALIYICMIHRHMHKLRKCMPYNIQLNIYISHTLLMISWQMSLCTLVSHSFARSVTQPVSDACNGTKLRIYATSRGIATSEVSLIVLYKSWVLHIYKYIHPDKQFRKQFNFYKIAIRTKLDA